MHRFKFLNLVRVIGRIERLSKTFVEKTKQILSPRHKNHQIDINHIEKAFAAPKCTDLQLSSKLVYKHRVINVESYKNAKDK